MSTNIDPNNLTLDDFNYFWMSNGAPCFIANNWDVVDDICESIESFGFQIYYLICDKATSKTVQQKDTKGVMVSTQVYSYEPAILKIVNNFTGRVVMPSNDSFGNGFAAVEEVAQYNMPPIPRIIVDKLDEFFRLVDAQHHTESIVILTYDTTKEGSDGWGVLVPDQENTSVHCKYDADSIAEIKPDHVMIVGSVHSHPGMPAYASGTDHADQADFDGLHITYGWQNSVNNGATQYHLELQIGGSAYTLKPEDVFETYTLSKDPDPEVVQWSSKVKKALPLYTGGSAIQERKYQAPQTQSYQTAWANQTANYQHTPAGTTTTTKDWSGDKKKFLEQLNAVPNDALVAIEIDTTKDEVDCLVCNFTLTKLDVDNLYCMTCDTPIITEEMSQYEILSSMHAYCAERYLDSTVPYYIYCTETSGSSFLVNIKAGGVDPVSQGSDYVLEDPHNLQPQIEFTVCCNVPVSASHECRCQKTVYESDIADFDLAHSKVDIYDRDTKCMDCSFYYDLTCPYFKKALVDFITYDKKVIEPIEECEQFVHYKEREVEYNYLAESTYYND